MFGDRYAHGTKNLNIPGLREIGGRRRLQAMCRVGWPVAVLAARMQVEVPRLEELLTDTRAVWSRPELLIVHRVYRDWGFRIPPGTINAADVVAIRRRAVTAGWASGLRWRDIDRDFAPEDSDITPKPTELDEVAIEHLMRGEIVECGRAEHVEAARRLRAEALTLREIGERLGWKLSRVEKVLSRLRAREERDRERGTA